MRKSSTAAFRKLASSKRLIVNAAERAGKWVQGQNEDQILEEDIEDMLEVHIFIYVHKYICIHIFIQIS